MRSKAFGVLVLLVLAATVTGVAESAAKTLPPTPLTGRWARPWGRPAVRQTRGKVEVRANGWYFARIKRGAAHQLRIGGIRSCSGTGTYRWGITDHGYEGLSSRYGYELAFKKIHDSCKLRVDLLARRDKTQRRPRSGVIPEHWPRRVSYNEVVPR